MKKILLIFTILFSINFFSQTKFEKGYFIDNANKKTECLIKNMDWNNSPISFEYKISENDIVNKKNIEFIKEFGVYNKSKYKRFDVLIDRSSENLNQLNFDKNPIFKNEKLFLKVLIEGNATLYIYKDENVKRFFYSISNSEPQQLIYKIYNIPDESKISYNNSYKEQLNEYLKCSSITQKDIDKLEYKETMLSNLFLKYNQCVNPNFILQKNENNKKLFVLNIRPSINFSTLSAQLSDMYFVTDFDRKASFGIGVEAEFIMPFNNNKWSVIVEPTYRYFKDEKKTDADYVSGNYMTTKTDYKSIDTPIGIRHYFFLNDKSKFFINLSYSFNINMKSTLIYTRSDGSVLHDLKMKSRGNIVFGTGYKYDRYSLEFRYSANRMVLANNVYWDSQYNTFSFIFGYTLF